LETKPFYSVYFEKKNISLSLLEEGLAAVAQHHINDNKSPDYESFLMAEQNAQKKSKGRFSKDLPTRKFIDLCPLKDNNSNQAVIKKAKQIIPFLQRKGRVSAVVEYVFNPTKFKIYIPLESCLIHMMLQGIKAPSKKQGESEPFADESLEFARDHCHQQDVEVEVLDVDKFGNFSGNIFVNKLNFSILLLQEGLSSVRAGSSRLPFYNDFVRAEQIAISAKKNIWKNWTPQVEQEKKKEEQEEDQKREEKAKQKRIFQAIITEVLDGGKFYCQFKGEDLSQLSTLMKQLQVVPSSSSSSWEPKNGTKCLALYDCDKQWYRAIVKQVLDQDKNNIEYLVYFIDYGNTDYVSRSSLRPIDSKQLSLPAQAKECCLALINVPSSGKDFCDEAAFCFKDLVWGKTMMANIEYQESGGPLHLSLGDPVSHVHVNAELVRRGFARVKRGIDRHPQAAKLREEEEFAKESHVNIWHYGDISDDEEDEAPKRGKTNSKRGKR
jgi:staphylococcal nuclease domain-containing protein 1